MGPGGGWHWHWNSLTVLQEGLLSADSGIGWGFRGDVVGLARQQGRAVRGVGGGEGHAGTTLEEGWQRIRVKGYLSIARASPYGIPMGLRLNPPPPSAMSGVSATAIALGYSHTCVVVTGAVAGGNASVKCWGSNGYGELGVGDTYKFRPVPIGPVDVDLGPGVC